MSGSVPTCGYSPASSRIGVSAGKLAALRIAHHGAAATIDLRLLAGCSDDHDAGFGHLSSAPLAREALHTLITAGEAVLGDSVLPDRPRLPASAEPQVDGFPVRLAGAGAGDYFRVGDHFVGLLICKWRTNRRSCTHQGRLWRARGGSGSESDVPRMYRDDLS
jgi:hypothetical protein